MTSWNLHLHRCFLWLKTTSLEEMLILVEKESILKNKIIHVWTDVFNRCRLATNTYIQKFYFMILCQHHTHHQNIFK